MIHSLDLPHGSAGRGRDDVWQYFDVDDVPPCVRAQMGPSGKNPAMSRWSRDANGYFAWKNSAGQALDINGNVVKKSIPKDLFEELTHIMYEGP